ncbi:hypothetical protein PHYSODRAFT_255952 [Phytophthora sojae]|uniref:Uncharacterized protein n=1 Tax=Phytophthora sojae (strain P6497) TaxID=1094619 RepID=G5A822_PHYSP|nr:hypothetical protein PHYSODRAFT_255952 [Phytophthora sojae]EGZ08048.1 hypothetical protein PHYSODRAFT_255952 [Phytophthora sojae]|eukprot:XP_009536220.1 hypothetical protein PHYSODRAFT_255952 [Phytophthora sojae]
MKFFSTLALLAALAQCTEGHQMLRAGATKSVDFSTLSGSGSDVGSMKHKPRDGSWDGKKPPRHPKGSFDGKMPDGSWGGHVGGRHGPPHHPKGSFDGSFAGHPPKWAGSFDGSFPGHGKHVPFPHKGGKARERRRTARMTRPSSKRRSSRPPRDRTKRPMSFRDLRPQ